MVECGHTKPARGGWWVVLVGFILTATSCGGPKQIRHYQPEVITDAVEARSTKTASDLTVAVENFSAGAVYDEQRMVYRTDSYRVDYYHFHRWGAPSGMIVGEALRNVYRQSGAFESVVGAYTTRADVVVSGRVLALEEVDVSKNEWKGHVALDMRIRDAATGELLWSETVRKRKTLAEQSPVGLARAVSEALTEIGLESVGPIVKHGREAVRKRRREQESNQSNTGPMEIPDESGRTGESPSSPSPTETGGN